MSINQIIDDSDVISHALERVDTLWVRIDLHLVSPCLADIIAILVDKLDSVQPNVEQVTVSRVQVQFEQETNRHGNGLILLEELHLAGS